MENVQYIFHYRENGLPISIQQQRDDFTDKFSSENLRAGFDVHLRFEECKEPTH